MQQFVKPEALKKGDTVGVIAPSDWFERPDKVRQGVKVLKEWGLKVKLGKYLFSRVRDFTAGTPTERREDILGMINDPEVKAIWAAAGGYAATEVLSVFNKETVAKLRVSPKWFIGYSDICLLLNALSSFRVASIHGPLIEELTTWDDSTREWLKKMLFGEKEMEIEGQANWKCLISGQAEGNLLISNLDSLITTFGSRFDPLMYGAKEIILGFEEWYIQKSTLQRQLDTILNHKHSDRIKGIVLGRFLGIDEQGYPKWGKSVSINDLIKTRVKIRGGIPTATLADYGHPDDYNWGRKHFPWFYKPERFLALPNGIRARLVTGTSGTSLRFLESIIGLPKPEAAVKDILATKQAQSIDIEEKKDKPS